MEERNTTDKKVDRETPLGAETAGQNGKNTSAKTKVSGKKDKKSKEDKKAAKQDELITILEAEKNELKDKYLRLYAEFDNYKKRVIKERLELLRSAAQDTLTSLLPVLDDFDRARESAEDETTEEVFSEGVALVYKKLYTILEQRGLQAMDTDGQPFDPEKHEAVSELEMGKDLKGKIVDTVEKGYLLNDKIIRFAKVVVGK